MMGRKAAKSATVSEPRLARLKNSKTLAFELVRLPSFERVRNGVRPKAMRRFFDDWQGHVDDRRWRDGIKKRLPEARGVHFR